MTMNCDWEGKTALGLTKMYYGQLLTNLRDVSTVDEVVRKVKAVFSKAYFDGCVSFEDGTDCGRIFEDWKDGKKGYTFIWFEKYDDKREWKEKLTTADIKAFYLRCANRAMDKVA